MSDSLLRDWVRGWIDTGRELDAIRCRELREMTDAQAKAAALDLLTMPLPDNLPPRLASGLVEQQRWFAILHRKA